MKTNQPLERIFHYNAQPFRTVQFGGEAWFVAVDICKMLGLAQVSRALRDSAELTAGGVRTDPYHPRPSRVSTPVAIRWLIASWLTPSARRSVVRQTPSRRRSSDQVGHLR